MGRFTFFVQRGIVATAVAALLPLTTFAEEDLADRVEALERQVQDTYREARATERAAVGWHLAGYADAGYLATNQSGASDGFTEATFAPVFHFLYRDWLLFEAELKYKTGGGDGDHGGGGFETEYASMNLLLHDYAALRIGQFLSPIGQFQERLHPSWINKLPNAPAGFGHGGAQPVSDIGAQLRGGFPLGGMLANYALYVGNGPWLEHDHPHGVELAASSADRDDKAVGGRIGLLPVPHWEFGASYLYKDNIEAEDHDQTFTPRFRLWGVDVAYTNGPWDLRGEYLRSELDRFGDTNRSEWNAWYVQAARRYGSWEPVLRYGEFESAGGLPGHNGDREECWTVGLNYVFAPSVIGKLAWENRSFDHDEDHRRVMLQFAYGF